MHGDDVVANTSVAKAPHMYMSVVEVLINNDMRAYALLDSGSTTSFCSQRIVDRLALKGVSANLNLSTLNNDSKSQSELVSVSLSSVVGEHPRDIACYVVEHIPAYTPYVDVSHYAYLQDFKFPCEVQVDMLIGQDNAGMMVPFEVRHGDGNQPFASRTLYGWCLNGPVPAVVTNAVGISNFVISSIEKDLEEMWSMDNEGIDTGARGMSRDDMGVLQKWNSECVFRNGRFELPIPWKDSSKCCNSNINVARSRLMSLTKSLKRRQLYKTYDAEIKQLLSKGYAEYVPNLALMDSNTWFLPHYCVAKKNGNIRIVFDCANRFDGCSLNDKCLSGPDLINRLSNVLLRFRQFEFAFIGDVESMYYQVVIPEDERDVLRFLWYDDEDCGRVKQLRMTRDVFGGVWCASSSTYALRKSTTVMPCSDDIKRIINDCFYVDDCLVSLPSRSEAVAIIEGTRAVLGNAGFKLTKFISNCEDVIRALPEEECLMDSTDVVFDECKALGVKWNSTRDELYFDKDLTCDAKVTKRSILRI